MPKVCRNAFAFVQVEVAGVDVTHDAVEQPPALLYGAAAVRRARFCRLRVCHHTVSDNPCGRQASRCAASSPVFGDAEDADVAGGFGR
jgi:hypothetical protein